ncbi:hypothetical protein [Oceanobacillus alkalisoli]|uniref:hypothetical protein n=1 Tax=Oceanobacillus alkalisoli TaxID=2925113 RepID=UPI001F11C235|nr:hypothetical protein [Oceanobacillus alkalisoli]MCF3944523.1 hypothetical protein [Oceanobacillus alkalisoli]
MALQDAINQNIQIRFINFPEELVGHVTGIYHPNDWLLAKLVDIDNFGIWLENPDYIRISVRDELGNAIPQNLQTEERVTSNVLIRWEFIGSIMRFPNEEINGQTEDIRTIGFN